MNKIAIITAISMCFILVISGDGLAAEKNNEKAAVKKAVLKRLTDPYSAKFGDFIQIDNYACITVNSRNQFGGYVGNHHLLLSKDNGEWDVVSMPTIMNHMDCKNVIKSFVLKDRAESDAIKVLIKHLNDPTIRSSDFSIVQQNLACLTITSKNYTESNNDNDVAFLKKVGKKWAVLSVDEIKHETCTAAAEYYTTKSQLEFNAIKAVLNSQLIPSHVTFGKFQQAHNNFACLYMNESSKRGAKRAILKINNGTCDVLSIEDNDEYSCRLAAELAWSQKVRDSIYNTSLDFYHRGKVLRKLKNYPYTYIEVEEPDANLWVAVLTDNITAEGIRIGDTVEFYLTSTKANPKIKQLKHTSVSFAGIINKVFD